MADRSSAHIFGELFDWVAKEANPEPDARDMELANKLWDMAQHYDFDWYQMECNESLIRLGLASRCSTCSGIQYKGDGHDCRDFR